MVLQRSPSDTVGRDVDLYIFTHDTRIICIFERI